MPAILSASVRAQILDPHVAQHAICEIHQMGAMRPPRIAYLVVLSIHEVKDGETRPNVTRMAVTFRHISGRCGVLPVFPVLSPEPWPLLEAKATRYAATLAAGEWPDTPRSITLDRADSSIIHGRHFVEGMIRSGVPMRVNVIWFARKSSD